MAVNKVIIQGRIPFELEIKNADDEKRAFLGFNVSVKRSYKPEGDQYYPEDMIYCKAFGATAKFINQYFSQGSNLIIEGEVRRDSDYEKDGVEVKGQMYIHIVPGGVNFQYGNAPEEGGNKTSAKAAAAPARKAAMPATKKLNPLSKKRII